MAAAPGTCETSGPDCTVPTKPVHGAYFAARKRTHRVAQLIPLETAVAAGEGNAPWKRGKLLPSLQGGGSEQKTSFLIGAEMIPKLRTSNSRSQLLSRGGGEDSHPRDLIAPPHPCVILHTSLWGLVLLTWLQNPEIFPSWDRVETAPWDRCSQMLVAREQSPSPRTRKTLPV